MIVPWFLGFRMLWFSIFLCPNFLIGFDCLATVDAHVQWMDEENMHNKILFQYSLHSSVCEMWESMSFVSLELLGNLCA